jgi:hypothetical protein
MAEAKPATLELTPAWKKGLTSFRIDPILGVLFWAVFLDL